MQPSTLNVVVAFINVTLACRIRSGEWGENAILPAHGQASGGTL